MHERSEGMEGTNRSEERRRRMHDIIRYCYSGWIAPKTGGDGTVEHGRRHRFASPRGNGGWLALAEMGVQESAETKVKNHDAETDRAAGMHYVTAKPPPRTRV